LEPLKILYKIFAPFLKFIRYIIVEGYIELSVIPSNYVGSARQDSSLSVITIVNSWKTYKIILDFCWWIRHLMRRDKSYPKLL